MEFISNLSEYFDICIFTASHECYAKPIIDYIDPNKKVLLNLYRMNCAQLIENLFVKDLSCFSDLDYKRALIVDNQFYSFICNLDNGIPISSFYHDHNDNQLK